MEKIDISGIDTAKLLVRLYHGTRARGIGRLHDLQSFDEPAAQRWLGEYPKVVGGPRRFYFDYVCGRPIKVSIEGDWILSPELYDRDTHPGACLEIVEALRREMAAEELRWENP